MRIASRRGRRFIGLAEGVAIHRGWKPLEMGEEGTSGEPNPTSRSAGSSPEDYRPSQRPGIVRRGSMTCASILLALVVFTHREGTFYRFSFELLSESR